jgi:hypothetical protein
MVGLAGACALTCEVRSGCTVVLELPVLAHATVATAVASVSACTFNIAFIVFTSSTSLLCNACTEASLT